MGVGPIALGTAGVASIRTRRLLRRDGTTADYPGVSWEAATGDFRNHTYVGLMLRSVRDAAPHAMGPVTGRAPLGA